MKIMFNTKIEAIEALVHLDVEPPRTLWVYPEGSHHVYGGRPWDYTRGTGRYFITDRKEDGNFVTKRVPGQLFRIATARSNYTRLDREAYERATA